MNTQLNKLFDKHTNNALNGQQIVDDIMLAANVKTTEDAEKVKAEYKARIKKHNVGLTSEESEKILSLFNTRRLRWMEKNGIKAKANTGSRAGKTKDGKVTKVTKKAAAAKARQDAAKDDSNAFVASMGKGDQKRSTRLHDMTSILAAISAISEKASKADCVAMAARDANHWKTIINSKK
jgi:hypothetical protein